MTNAGLPSGSFLNVAEVPKGAAILKIDYAGNVSTYATGFRNLYDLVWHTNGQLYVNDNGPNAGLGNAPDPFTCGAPGYDPGDQPDELNRIDVNRYYGHPNPSRGECIFDSGPNYFPPMYTYGLHTSSDGITEYTGSLMTGYWLLSIEAHQADGRRQGIYLQAWSAQAEGFESENREVLKAVESVERYAPRRALWVIDSGGDRSRLHRAFKQLEVRYLVRVKRERVVSWHGARHKIMAVAQEALWCGSFRFAHRTRRGRWRKLRVRYGFERIVWQEDAYSLVVAEGISDERLILWTSEVVTTAQETERVVRAYLRRWAVEDADRVLKQEFALERIRVTDWLRVRRLVLLAGMAYGFVGFISRKGQRVVKKLVELARRLRPPKKVIAYAIRKGIAALWAAGLLKRPSFGFG
jgi:hypothetical protein